MRERLRELLVCPACAGTFDVREFSRHDNAVSDGVLICGCGETYPIVREIPRIFTGAWDTHVDWWRANRERLADLAGAKPGGGPDGRDVKQRTQASFGYQWTAFAEMTREFEQNFLNYIAPVEPSFFPGKLGLDAGCGFGRHIHYAAKYGAEMVGIDYSAAIESTRRNTAGMRNVHLVQADIYRLPFRPGTFDFAYSFGVLHHLPDPLAAYVALHRVIRPEGFYAVWLYSKTRRRLNAVLELVRRVTPSLPFPALKGLSFIAASVDWTFFIYPYRMAARTPVKPLADFLTFDRIKVYAAYPFQVAYADWFDRLSPPIRFYYDEADLLGWAAAARLRDVSISPTGKYGWRLQGRIPAAAEPGV